MLLVAQPPDDGKFAIGIVDIDEAPDDAIECPCTDDDDSVVPG